MSKKISDSKTDTIIDMLGSAANINTIDPIRSSINNGFGSSKHIIASSHHIYEHAQRDN